MNTKGMKVSRFGLVLMVFTLFLFPAGVPASEPPPTPQPGQVQVDSNGNIVGEQPETAPQANAPEKVTALSILCYTTQNPNPCNRVSAIFTGVTQVNSPGAFPANLSSYDVVYIGYGEGSTLDSKSAQLQSYVQNGGGLIVSQPNLSGTVNVYPPGFEMTVTDIAWPGFPSPPGPVEFTHAGSAHPILNGLTPADPSGNFDTIPLSTLGPGWTVLVKSVSYPHMALAAGTYGSGRLVFHSGNIASTSVDPGSDAYVRQMIEWTGADSTPGPDMQINHIEVTQAVQDLGNSVDLVAGKRTYVRVHVSSPTTIDDVSANLSGSKGGVTLYPTLLPGNPGADITVRSSPNRGLINDSFWFELPASWLGSGNLTLTARLDPANAKNDPNLSNNNKSLVVNLQNTPPLRLRLVNVRYTVGTTTYLANNTHLDRLESWLRRAYPISSLQVVRTTFTYPNAGLPNVDTLNAWLAFSKLIRIIFAGENPRTVYYGMVDDGGGFMRGKAAGIPGTVASGPTGPGTFGWDTDGSYGDWYGGHEIAHTRNRYHAEFCGAAAGAAYPYPNGVIGGPTGDTSKFYGFDIQSRAVYDPNWKDVMTYCSNQWISDFTYEGIRNYLVSVGLAEASLAMASAEEFLAVSGMANLDNNTAELLSVYRIQQSATLPLPEPGDWSIVLLSGGGSTLATYPFAPEELTDAENAVGTPAVISEVVPFVNGTVKLEIRYQGATVASRSASPNPPGVNITSPEDGASLGEGPFTATWTASDPDGDPLSYSVLYSDDGGNSWEALAAGITEKQLELNTDQLPGGENILLRVVASDGFLTGMDDTGPFSVPLHPPLVNIESPQPDQFFYPGQLVVLQGSAYDLEDGPLGDDAYFWSSSLDGELGQGANLNTVDLTTGDHLITLGVTDSNGQTAQAQTTLRVLSGDEPEPVALDVTPLTIGVVVEQGGPAEDRTVALNSSDGSVLNWSASEDADWMSLSPAAGSTPGELEVTVDPSGLAPGSYEGKIQISAAGAENSPVEIPVVLEVLAPPGGNIYLPIVMKQN